MVRSRQRCRICPALSCIATTLVLFATSHAARAADPADPTAKLGVSRGICVVLGDAAPQTAERLARQSELTIYIQVSGRKALEAARQSAAAAGLYGTRIYVERGPANRLYLADNLADAVVVLDGATLPEAEILRVLRPQGKAFIAGREIVKPARAGEDAWSHPYHGPDNNPQSRDEIARAPYLTQFLADPRYAPLPQVAVAAGGRVFKAFGHIAFKPREEPWLNTLAAFNGYNGTFLWRREIPGEIMIHRNTLIATAERVYFGDDQSCKVFDAATGELVDEIKPPADQTGGTFWKWMALEDGVLYAMIGEQEQRDPTIRLRREAHGWPWDPLSPGYNQPENPWGFGRTLVAIDPATHKILWRYEEAEPIDSRALAMSHDRIYAFRIGGFLTCIDAKTGKPLWRKTPADDAALFASLGENLNRQDWRTNWRTTAYLKASEHAIYFAGPQVKKLLAVSADDGRVLWEDAYSNYQLILRDDGLYALSGQMGQEVGMRGANFAELSRQPAPSRRFDPLTGKVLAEITLGRRACTRPTGAIDAVFCRANGGSTRLDAESEHPGLVSPMRAQCQDGVTIANGLLYWWPSTCDCNLTLYGITCLGPAGDFDFAKPATEAERLEVLAENPADVAAWPESPGDWPTLRHDSIGSATTDAAVPIKVRALWRHQLPEGVTPTAPTAVRELAFVAGSDGVVRALAAASGKPAWQAFTGGAIRVPPAIDGGRALAGSGDGCVYAWEARTGRPLWRFRAAPAERRIPVYGQIQSTWPVGGGVLVHGGVAYAAAGIVNYDSTHVYALDPATGRLKWQNNNSGHLDPEARTGVSVQGTMLAHADKLYLPGGNVISPAVYDLQDGRLLNDPAQHVRLVVNNNVPLSAGPRGSELYLIGDHVMVSGKPWYAHPQYPVYDASVEQRTMLASVGERDFAWINSQKLVAYPRVDEGRTERFVRSWGRPNVAGLTPLWTHDCPGSRAIALGRNAAVLALGEEVRAVDLASGKVLWSEKLPAPPVPWGLALDRHGRIVVTLENGLILCFG